MHLHWEPLFPLQASIFKDKDDMIASQSHGPWRWWPKAAGAQCSMRMRFPVHSTPWLNLLAWTILNFKALRTQVTHWHLSILSAGTEPFWIFFYLQDFFWPAPGTQQSWMEDSKTNSSKLKAKIMAIVTPRHGGAGKKGDTTPPFAEAVLLGKGTRPGGDSKTAEVICTASWWHFGIVRAGIFLECLWECVCVWLAWRI